MATKKDTFDILTEKPTSKTQITKSRMLRYIKERGTEEDKAWFKTLCMKNMTKVKSNLDGKTREDINVKIVRDAFVTRFFGYLNETKKKEKKTFLDELKEL